MLTSYSPDLFTWDLSDNRVINRWSVVDKHEAIYIRFLLNWYLCYHLRNDLPISDIRITNIGKCKRNVNLAPHNCACCGNSAKWVWLFNITMLFYQYRKSHVGDKTVSHKIVLSPQWGFTTWFGTSVMTDYNFNSMKSRSDSDFENLSIQLYSMVRIIYPYLLVPLSH